METIKEFQEYISSNRNEKEIKLFFDIETLQFNEKEGTKKPTLFNNVTYSVCVGWAENWSDDNTPLGEIKKVAFWSFKGLFDSIFEALAKRVRGQLVCPCKASINLIAHNNNKYDNHFLLKDLTYFYPDIERKNIYLSSAISNEMTVKKSDLKKIAQKNNLVLEKRVKSSNNLELDIYMKGLHFFTTDNWVKTNLTIRTLGLKLLKKNLIKKEQLKTDFDYLKYNLDENMSQREAYHYAKKVFEQLTDREMVYIENDVIILGKAVLFYTDLFPNFDYSKITFTSNILAFYKTNELTKFQLLNEIGEGKQKNKIQYTDFYFQNENFYDYLKPFYRGGLNFYNFKYLGKTIKEMMFSIDINSSYPYVMYDFKIPTFLKDFKEFKDESEIEIKDDDYYYLYRMTKESFNNEILLEIDSIVIKQMLVKYLNTNDYVNINTYTIKLIEKIIKRKISKISVLSYLVYECEDFGAKHKLAENYFIKTQGKLDNEIIMENPMDYFITDNLNTNIFSEEEIANSKVLMNGLYGIPALRAFFNLFRILPDGSMENIKNGYKNSERNLVFSIFVTSVALYNLLDPLSYLTEQEIDDNFVYCDTDSLYLLKAIKNKLPVSLFDKISLGKWDIEHENISSMYVLNHKKYALYDEDKKEIIVKCGGINLDSFAFYTEKETGQLFTEKQLNNAIADIAPYYEKKKVIKQAKKEYADKWLNALSFDDFIETQFHDKATIKNTKSIYNENGTISIYESSTQIEKGNNYPIYFSKKLDEMKNNLLKRIAEEEPDFDDDLLYIESELGIFSEADLHPHKNEVKNKSNLFILKAMTNKIKALI